MATPSPRRTKRSASSSRSRGCCRGSRSPTMSASALGAGRKRRAGPARPGRDPRAAVPRPQVPLLAEPFSALDAFTRVDLQDHLLDLWADAKPTLLVVTHDVEEAVVLADRVLVMR